MRWYVFVLLGLVVSAIAVARWGREVELSRAVDRIISPLFATPTATPAATPAAPQGRLQGVRLVEQTDKATAWEIMADDASFYAVGQVTAARGVRAQLFREQAALLSLEADQGLVRHVTGDITVRGHVRVQHREGYTVTADALDWQGRHQTLYTDMPVQIDGPAIRITGTGLRSDKELQHFRLQRNVRAWFRLR